MQKMWWFIIKLLVMWKMQNTHTFYL